MSSSVQLKNFQWASVNAVLKGLRGRGVFSLADEVGLGKTLVCAEVAYQLLVDRTAKRTNLIYYVAPSIELLDQNLKSIARYIRERSDGQFKVRPAVSRLSQVPLNLVLEESGRVIHLIGLSPGTSFRVSGAGQYHERAYLAALLGYRREMATKEELARFFWCLKSPFDKWGEHFERTVESYSKAENLRLLDVFRQSIDFEKIVSRARALGISGENLQGNEKGSRGNSKAGC